MKKRSILEFLKNGQFEDLPFGIELQQLILEIGENTDWMVPISRKDKRPGLIKYGQMEFYLDHSKEQRLLGIQITYTQAADTQGFEMDFFDLKAPLSYEACKTFMLKNQVDFEETYSAYDEEDPILKTSGGIKFRFDDDKLLQKFGRFVGN